MDGSSCLIIVIMQYNYDLRKINLDCQGMRKNLSLVSKITNMLLNK